MSSNLVLLKRNQIGTIQGLVMQSLLAGTVSRIGREAPACLPSIAVASKATHETPVFSASATATSKPFHKSRATNMTAHSGRSIWMRVVSLIAIGLAQLMTIWEGGAVLFVDGAAHGRRRLCAFRALVQFSGRDRLHRRRRRLVDAPALGRVVSDCRGGDPALVFLAFGVHVALGGAWERRTVVAMTLRTLVWAGIAAIAWRRSAANAPVAREH